MSLSISFAVPSAVLSAIKPSATTTSKSPLNISRASQLPTKFISLFSLSKAYASLLSSLPLCASTPLFNNPTRGFSTPSIACAYDEAIIAKCRRFIGFESTLAPQSQSTTPLPSRVGSTGASAGRDTPFILPTFINAPTSTAPVEPADTKASHSSSEDNFSNALTSELSFFVFIAIVGLSSFEISSCASIISILDLSYSHSASCLFIASLLPTNTNFISLSSFKASIAPSTVSFGA